jgi:hypothetical protein
MLAVARTWSPHHLTRARVSWAAAHLADENVPGDAALSPPVLDMIEINRVGQVPHGLISRLTEPCLAQYADHFLSGVLHSYHCPLSLLKNRCGSGT